MKKFTYLTLLFSCSSMAITNTDDTEKNSPIIPTVISFFEKTLNSITDMRGTEMLVTSSNSDLVGNYKQYNFNHYSILLKCSDRSASVVWSDVKENTGNIKRKSNFTYTDKVPRACQPLSLYSFKSTGTKFNFDRGHKIDSNFLDYSEEAITESNLMLNIAPQISSTNRTQAWRHTEKIVNCYRDTKGKLITGVIWGTNQKDDYFIKSHGVKTPDYFWKIFIYKNDSGTWSSNSWAIPNTYPVKMRDLDSYLVTPNQINEAMDVDISFLIPPGQQNFKAAKSLELPKNCDFT